MIDPTKVRLSDHFLLSDFLGNHSIYTQGLANVFPDSSHADAHRTRIANGQALCAEALEPILARHGALSISYGFISPDVSRAVVGYQDPNKPSHHRWDLGAAADICVHGWVNCDPDDDTTHTAPIMLAHDISRMQVRYSRIITYSESPYICVAVSARELDEDKPRRAFYENRYTGQAKVKPDYRTMSTDTARHRNYELLRPCPNGLAHGWRGAGYPTYHGGGRRQYQHIRVSKYSMLSDWLFDVQSIANGAKNMPQLRDPDLWAMFCAVGDMYDSILERTKVPRMSIVSGYVHPSNPFFDPANDWRTGTASFKLVPPAYLSADEVRTALLFENSGRLVGFGNDPEILEITVRL